MTIRKARQSDIPVLNELLQDILQVHYHRHDQIFLKVQVKNFLRLN